MKIKEKIGFKPIWIIAILCIWAISIMLIEILTNGEWFWDYPIYNFIIGFRCDVITIISKILAKIGGRAGLAICCSIAMLISLIKYKNKKLALLILVNIFIIGCLNYVLKNIIQRPRPEGIRMIDIDGYSFPSGHSMGAIGLWGLLIIIAYYKIKNIKTKTIVIALLSIIILNMGLSRIYLGVHYASDVICGFLITILYFCAIIPIVKRVIQVTD